jgi:kynurenine formamidase
LLDIAGAKGQDRLPIGYVITPNDLQSTLDKMGLTIRAGDVVLIRTGHGELWMKDNTQFAEGEPGIGLQSARWLSDRRVALVGCDNWAVEAVPPENPQRPFEAHQWLLVRNGIYLLENLDLDELAKDHATEFAFSFAPLRLRGATGSPGNPLAIR